MRLISGDDDCKYQIQINLWLWKFEKHHVLPLKMSIFLYSYDNLNNILKYSLSFLPSGSQLTYLVHQKLFFCVKVSSDLSVFTVIG